MVMWQGINLVLVAKGFSQVEILISMKLSPCHGHKNYECNVIKKIKINMN